MPVTGREARIGSMEVNSTRLYDSCHFLHLFHHSPAPQHVAAAITALNQYCGRSRLNSVLVDGCR